MRCFGASWGAVVLLYAGAVGTAAGRELDDAVSVRADGFARMSSDALIATTSVGTLAVAGVVAVLLVARRGNARGAFGVALFLIGANTSTFILSHVLAAVALLDGESKRSLGEGFFPSGHATAAMSMACAVVAAVPTRHVTRTAVVASAYVSVVAVALLAPGNHYFSDVLGGVLVAAGWQSLLRETWADRPAVEGTTSRTAVRLLTAAVAAVLLTSLVFGVRPDEEPAVVIASALVTGCAFVVGHAAVGQPHAPRRRRSGEK